jgi:hypothetical protein
MLRMASDPILIVDNCSYQKRLIKVPKIQPLQIKRAIFADPPVSPLRGKLYVIKTVFSIDCGGLGATFLSHSHFDVK